MKFIKALAFPIWPNLIRVQWSVDNFGLKGNYVFNLLLNDVPVCPPLLNTTTVTLDYTLLQTEIRNNINLTLTGKSPKGDTAKINFSLYHQLAKKEYLIAKEIVRKENLRFEKQIGVKIVILKQKHLGEPCPSCLDELTGVVTNPFCEECYGLRFLGGYDGPFSAWGEISELPVSKQITVVGTTEDKTAQLRATNEVLLNKQDIVVDLVNNNRWIVTEQPSFVFYRTFPISQQTNLIMREPSDIIYKFPIEGINSYE